MAESVDNWGCASECAAPGELTASPINFKQKTGSLQGPGTAPWVLRVPEMFVTDYICSSTYGGVAPQNSCLRGWCVAMHMMHTAYNEALTLSSVLEGFRDGSAGKTLAAQA